MDAESLIRQLRVLKVKNAEGNALVREAGRELSRLAAESKQRQQLLSLALSQLAAAAECNTCMYECDLEACQLVCDKCSECEYPCHCRACYEGSLWRWSGDLGGANAT